MKLRAALLVLAAGCGRFGFDAGTSDLSGDSYGTDAGGGATGIGGGGGASGDASVVSGADSGTSGATSASALVSDAFGGPDLTLLSAHAPDVGGAGTWQSFNGRELELFGNRVRAVSKNQDSSYLSNAVLPASVAVRVTGLWDNTNTSNRVGLLARATAAGTGYYLYVTGAGTYSFQRLDGAATLLQSGTVTLSLNVPHQIELRVSDVEKAFYFDGQLITSTTDNALTSGGAGVMVSWFTTQTAALADDFAVQPMP